MEGDLKGIRDPKGFAVDSGTTYGQEQARTHLDRQGDRPRLEPRILLEDTSNRTTLRRGLLRKDQFDNRLIFGDNLLALKSFNRRFRQDQVHLHRSTIQYAESMFEHYDDGVEHSIWLSQMRDRLEFCTGYWRAKEPYSSISTTMSWISDSVAR